MIGKKLHVSELIDIPSTTKSNEDKLKDESFLLRGSIMAGNNNPQLLRKFKIVLLKMKNNILISLHEYNEILYYFRVRHIKNINQINYLFLLHNGDAEFL